ncbi:MAG: long-chain-fatty-acid--CoA ligase [Thermodesulfobacteriota bacterium]|nr:long-chain-fatty-acid--CoA ligase [Thermodesulfobacteriota bacterium]
MTEIIKGFPSTSQDNYQLNVINIMRQAVKSFARQEIVCDTPNGRIRSNYAESYIRMKKLANALKKIGVKVGDRIGVMDWNTNRHFEMYYGIPGTGSVLLLLNLRLSSTDLSYVVNHAEAKFIFVDETLLPLIEGITSMCKSVKAYVVLTDKKLSEINTSLTPLFSYEELLKEADEEYTWPILDETSAYGACYTTGTTGRPKGVYYSHRDIFLHAMAVAVCIQISFRDSYYQLVPMFHAMGWGGAHAAVLAGAKYVLPGMYNTADLGGLAEPLVSEGITISAGAPALLMPMLEYLKKLDKKPDLSNTRFLCGATEPSISMMKAYKELTGAEIQHAYGATEATPLVCCNHIKPWLEKELTEDEKWDLKRKQGLVAIGLDVRIVDSEGNDQPRDGKSPGEILIRGPWITSSYYNEPGSEDNFSKDGFWKSGDAGTIDEEGYLKITDRVKDLIKSGGEWISSVDMENEIMGHPSVLEAAVAGVQHPKWEERPVALVVLRKEFKHKVKAEEIRSHIAKKFAKWQLPESVLFVDTIPRTSIGKADKKVIRSEYKDLYMK